MSTKSRSKSLNRRGSRGSRSSTIETKDRLQLDPIMHHRQVFVLSLRRSMGQGGNCNWSDVRHHYKKASGRTLNGEELNWIVQTQGKTRMEIFLGELSPIIEVVDHQGNVICPNLKNSAQFVNVNSSKIRNTLEVKDLNDDSAAASISEISPNPSMDSEPCEEIDVIGGVDEPDSNGDSAIQSGSEDGNSYATEVTMVPNQIEIRVIDADEEVKENSVEVNVQLENDRYQQNQITEIECIDERIDGIEANHQEVIIEEAMTPDLQNLKKEEIFNFSTPDKQPIIEIHHEIEILGEKSENLDQDSSKTEEIHLKIVEIHENDQEKQENSKIKVSNEEDNRVNAQKIDEKLEHMDSDSENSENFEIPIDFVDKDENSDENQLLIEPEAANLNDFNVKDQEKEEKTVKTMENLTFVPLKASKSLPPEVANSKIPILEARKSIQGPLDSVLISTSKNDQGFSRCLLKNNQAVGLPDLSGQQSIPEGERLNVPESMIESPLFVDQTAVLIPGNRISIGSGPEIMAPIVDEEVFEEKPQEFQEIQEKTEEIEPEMHGNTENCLENEKDESQNDQKTEEELKNEVRIDETPEILGDSKEFEAQKAENSAKITSVHPENQIDLDFVNRALETRLKFTNSFKQKAKKSETNPKFLNFTENPLEDQGKSDETLQKTPDFTDEGQENAENHEETTENEPKVETEVKVYVEFETFETKTYEMVITEPPPEEQGPVFEKPSKVPTIRDEIRALTEECDEIFRKKDTKLALKSGNLEVPQARKQVGSYQQELDEDHWLAEQLKKEFERCASPERTNDDEATDGTAVSSSRVGLLTRGDSDDRLNLLFPSPELPEVELQLDPGVQLPNDFDKSYRSMKSEKAKTRSDLPKCSIL